VRIFSYRNKRHIKQFIIVLAVVLSVLLMFCVCRFIYLQRYLIYSGGQVSLDFNQTLDRAPQDSVPKWDPSTVQIITKDPAIQQVNAADEPMKQLTGFYISTEMFKDLDYLNAALAEQQDIKTIMLDLKSVYGNFYYSSGTPGAKYTTAADVPAVDDLIERLAEMEGVYLIARIASLSDPNFALANQSCGLPLRSGALWVDDNNCYWLDPMATAVQEYLVTIAQELAVMGFDEVVFDDFRIPESTNIVYRSELSREDAAAEAAKSIRALLATDPIRVSFNSSNPKVAEVSDRVYLVTDDGASVAGLVDNVKEPLEDPTVQIVFLTASRDTRFDGYGLLRPLIEQRAE